MGIVINRIGFSFKHLYSLEEILFIYILPYDYFKLLFYTFTIIYWDKKYNSYMGTCIQKKAVHKI